MMQPYIFLTLLPTLALAGTIVFSSGSDCGNGIEQTSADDTCTEAPAGARASWIVKEMGACTELTFFTDGNCEDNQMTYDELIQEIYVQPKYEYTHHAFEVC